MRIVAKLTLTQMVLQHYGKGETCAFTFHVQYDEDLPEDQRFESLSNPTPNGELTVTIDNPPVRDFLKQNMGKQFKLQMMPYDESK